MVYYELDKQGILLRLYVQPGAAGCGIQGLHGDALKLKVAAPAREGRANDAVIALLAEYFRLPKNRVTIRRGHSSRHKEVFIEGDGLSLRSRLPGGDGS